MLRKERRLKGECKSKKWDRKFLGKLDNFENETERAFEKKHIKAYLKGHERFHFGYEERTNSFTGLMETVPAYHTVAQELTEIK